MRRMALRAAMLIFLTARLLPLWAETVDLNQYYRFPVSVGVGYDSLTALAAFNTPYTIFDVGGVVTVPIPRVPVLQPFLRFGIVRFDSIDAAFPDKWDHLHLYGLLGISYTSRFAKNFEGGAELSVGVSDAIFPKAVDTGTVSSPYLLVGLGGRISLIPSYSFAINFDPSVRYQVALSPLDIFNGFLLSFGVSAGFRFGEDPDSARAIIRSLRFDQAQIPAVFSAMQGFYAKNRIGTVTIVNTERQPVTDLEVSFFQPGYMDSPTASASLPRLAPGESATVSLLAVFNNEVFKKEGRIPLSGQIIATYKLAGRAAEQKQPVTYDLMDKTAITWTDDRKIGAFITPQDSALKNYTAWVNETIRARDYGLPNYNEPLQTAMQVYDALRVLGIFYQEDPSSPFTRVQGATEAVDSVTLPRLTLKRKYGDCDDLTALFCSLLETRNIETGIITVPGHIYATFNTKAPASAAREFSPDKGMILLQDDSVWVPVEVTMLDGNSGFLEAWTRGIELWKANEKTRAFYRTRAAQEVYGPVVLDEKDLGLQYGNEERIAAAFKQDRDRLGDVVLKSLAAESDRSRSKADYNRLGMLSAQFGRLREAEDAFGRALKIDAKYTSALVNLGNVYYLRKDYRKAIDTYRSVIPLLGKPDKGSFAANASIILLVNMARAYGSLGNTGEARNVLAQATQIDPEKAQSLASLTPIDPGTSRAADASVAGRVSFLEEEER
jgi:tetratricopeptide (TPR) repeat protein